MPALHIALRVPPPAPGQHQFADDPDRDPNVLQIWPTDTLPDVPLRPRKLVALLLGLVSPAPLLGFLRGRVKDNSFGTRRAVYAVLGAEPARAADGTSIDGSVLEDCDATERDAIRTEERAATTQDAVRELLFTGPRPS